MPHIPEPHPTVRPLLPWASTPTWSFSPSLLLRLLPLLPVPESHFISDSQREEESEVGNGKWEFVLWMLDVKMLIPEPASAKPSTLVKGSSVWRGKGEDSAWIKTGFFQGLTWTSRMFCFLPLYLCVCLSDYDAAMLRGKTKQKAKHEIRTYKELQRP